MKFNKQLQKRRSILAVALFSMALLVLVACGPSASPQTTTPKTQVTYQMGWTHGYSAAGFYAAEKNGHFAAQNLDVNLQVGGFNDEGFIDSVAQVLAGKADFGATSAIGLITARSEGKPIVAIAAILQRSPAALISLAENNITRPTDLLGKRLAISTDSATILYKAFLSSQGIDATEVDTVPRTSFGIDPLLNGEVDVLNGWIINEGVMIKEAGLEPNFILMDDYGINSYDFIIFTTETIIAEQPDMVERFLRAVIQGHQDVVAQPKQAVEFTLAYNDTLVAEEQERRLQASLPLINPAGGSIGMMQPEIWERTHQMLLDQEILSEPLDLNKAYTLAFLEKIYSE